MIGDPTKDRYDMVTQLSKTEMKYMIILMAEKTGDTLFLCECVQIDLKYAMEV